MTPTRRPSRKGATAMVVLLALPVLLAFLVFVVDVGYARVVQAQLQVAADAAAAAGASELDHSDVGMLRARGAAIFVAGLNTANGQDIDLDAGDVDLGFWDAGSETFIVSSDPEVVDSVRVRARIADLPAFFGRAVFGSEPLATAVLAVAIRGRDLGAGRVPW